MAKHSADVNVSAFVQNLLRLQKAAGDQKDTLLDCAELIMDESTDQIPVDTGTAQSTAFINAKKARGRWAMTVDFGYTGDAYNEKRGKNAGDYLVELHEDLNAPHRNGKAKFLEDPINTMSDVVSVTIRDGIEKKLKANAK